MQFARWRRQKIMDDKIPLVSSSHFEAKLALAVQLRAETTLARRDAPASLYCHRKAKGKKYADIKN
jgi:hypothetical protein